MTILFKKVREIRTPAIDFREEGTVYIKEGAALDTLSYTLLSDTTMLIESFGIALNGIPDTSFRT